MRIVIEDECWTHDDATWRQEMVRLLITLEEKRQHSIDTDIEKMASWCAISNPEFVQVLPTRAMTISPRAGAVTLTVHPGGASEVLCDPPWRLTASAARGCVKRPLKLVVENDLSDRRFVAASIPAFQTWESSEWIDVVNGGGSNLAHKIDQAKQHQESRWRTFFLFDSDRLHPDELSADWTRPGGDGCQGFEFERRCAEIPDAMPKTRWHRLNRRSIENYLPNTLLQNVDLSAAQALASGEVGEMAKFYNMKRGLKGDWIKPKDGTTNIIRRGRSKGAWERLPEAIQSSLMEGFGEHVAEQFKNVLPTEPWPQDVRAEADALELALLDAL